MKSSEKNKDIAIVCHGGAWDIPDELVVANKRGVENAVLIGIEILRNNGSALDAVEESIKSMEDDPSFDAGTGSVLTTLGTVEMDAAIMDGRTLNAGAVAALTNIQHPISLARRVLEESIHVMLVGEGAQRFARASGFKEYNSLIVERIKELWDEIKKRMGDNLVEGYLEAQTNLLKKYPILSEPSGTVGAVAIDTNGNIAAGTSTGGLPMKLPGRVGDSPLIGCGTYADNETAGISATGHGESIIKIVLAKNTCDLIQNGLSVQDAVNSSLDIMWKKTSARGGLIAIDSRGEIGITYNTSRMARAYIKDDKGKKGSSYSAI